MTLSSGSRKNSVRCRQSGRSHGSRMMGTALAASSAWQASTAGGGTRNASWIAAEPDTAGPSSQTRQGPLGRQRQQCGADPEADPIFEVALDGKPHHVLVEGPGLLQTFAEPDRVVEVAYFLDAHLLRSSRFC